MWLPLTIRICHHVASVCTVPKCGLPVWSCRWCSWTQPALLPCLSQQNCKWLVGVEDDRMWQLMRRVVGNMCQRQCTLTYIRSEACLNHMGEEKVAFWIRSSVARFNFQNLFVLKKNALIKYVCDATDVKNMESCAWAWLNSRGQR